MTIRRIWRGWTTPEKADAYEALLLDEVIPSIEEKRIPGFRSIEVLRERVGEEVEFATIMTFDALENVVDFQGEDYARCYVPAAARAVLSRWDEISRHYEVRAQRTQPTALDDT